MSASRVGLVVGLAGLIGFEAIVFFVLVSGIASGFWQFPAMAAIAAFLLAVQLVLVLSGRGPSAPVWLGLAAVTLWRALQQQFGGFWFAELTPTYLVPMGFVLLAWAASRTSRALVIAGVVFVAFARSWFVWVYGFPQPISVANLVAAVGLWSWVVLLVVAARRGEPFAG